MIGGRTVRRAGLESYGSGGGYFSVDQESQEARAAGAGVRIDFEQRRGISGIRQAADVGYQTLIESIEVDCLKELHGKVSGSCRHLSRADAGRDGVIGGG